ncbi:hypothetical protein BDW02DRAFT_600691 [Decorospora gaudefroyi]|uniref:Uncharacterized protein n=1 Tax=Decorospora gaudefroyi TaxID=184978 RepID=A0A6A5K2X9_9PLEO|nr:hypothetical protein BDW02DRAFT_600691 [Decorospora gaudefroyi]
MNNMYTPIPPTPSKTPKPNLFTSFFRARTPSSSPPKPTPQTSPSQSQPPPQTSPLPNQTATLAHSNALLTTLNNEQERQIAQQTITITVLQQCIRDQDAAHKSAITDLTTDLNTLAQKLDHTQRTALARDTLITKLKAHMRQLVRMCAAAGECKKCGTGGMDDEEGLRAEYEARIEALTARYEGRLADKERTIGFLHTRALRAGRVVDGLKGEVERMRWDWVDCITVANGKVRARREREEEKKKEKIV